jgi:hypothetical protein
LLAVDLSSCNDIDLSSCVPSGSVLTMLIRKIQKDTKPPPRRA